MFTGKKILVGICGGIAAYKVCELVRELQRKGAIVRTMLTPDATRFISPLTFASLTGAPASVDLFSSSVNEIEHIELATWPDIIAIAPATATTIAKISSGLADNLVTATLLATRAKILLAPAMNTGMWQNPATQDNISLLKNRGYFVVDPEYGPMATSLEGAGFGRLPENRTIISHLFRILWPTKSLENKKVTITAGCTIEKIDPVRFISNHATGKMGFALAEIAAAMGAQVTLVHGPTFLKPPVDIDVIQVESAHEMMEATHENYPERGILIGAAAVSDYRPAEFSQSKIKKDKNNLTLKLKINPDILFELKKKKTNSIHVGFALETNNEIENAAKKIVQKGLDIIVVNNPAEDGAGFAVDTNKVKLMFADGKIIDLPLKEKINVAAEILKHAAKLLNNK
ncbi:MAG: bifunctional phosphopantothenoylcysteine decarboxylase/phosphopantothenate--cysteine ligase CoaBC [Calditrichaeota bacterium]|nr:MAG: bifunctional phosphopantothenoylcysteine decarboxylase/phosphopantothenate--cysteine ligase CoaBC [Calditrichota bacterium]